VVDTFLLLSFILIIFMPMVLFFNKKRRILELPQLLIEALVFGFFGLTTIVTFLLTFQIMGRTAFFVSLCLAFAVPLVLFLRTKRPSLRLRSGLGVVNGGLLVAMAGAIILRQEPSYYIFMTGDMGQYINVANYAINGGHQLFAGFLHMFTSMFMASNYFLGTAGAVAILPVIGLATVAALLLLLKELGVGGMGLLIAGGFAAFGLMPVWYSKFPVSEALYSFQLLFTYYLMAKCRLDIRWTYVFALFLAYWEMALTRGNIFFTTITLLPFYIIYSQSIANTGRKRVGLVMAPFAGLLCGYIYDIEKVTKVFVKIYLNKYLGSFYETMVNYNLVQFGWQLLLFAAVAAVTLFLTLGIVSFVSATLKLSERFFVSLLVMIGVGLLIVLRSTNRLGLTATADYFDWTLVYMGGLGLIAVFLRPFRYKSVFMTAYVALVTAILYSRNIEADRTHIHFLYYQRYTFPELYWSLVCFAGIGAHEVYRLLNRLSIHPYFRVIPISAGVGIFGLTSFQGIRANLPHFKKTILQNAYHHLAEINAVMERKSDPVFFSGFSKADTTPKNWFFPNMFRSYMFPLFYTFNRDLALPMPENAFQNDPISTPESMFARLGEMGKKTGYLVMVNRETSESLPENLWNQLEGQQDGIRWKHLKTIDKVLLNATHPDKFESPQFYDIPVQARVFDISMVN